VLGALGCTNNAHILILWYHLNVKEKNSFHELISNPLEGMLMPNQQIKGIQTKNKKETWPKRLVWMVQW
jgi:hypothetical protein